MTRLPTAASPTASVIDSLRPRRSDSQPNSRPPNGLATKPTAKTPNDASRSETGDPVWKNCGAKNAANVAETVQSKYSIPLPVPTPTIARAFSQRSDLGRSVCGAAFTDPL